MPSCVIDSVGRSAPWRKRPWIVVGGFDLAKARWPVLAAAAVAVFSLLPDDADENAAEILPLLPLIYLLVAKLGRRNLTWPVLAGSFVVVFGLQALDIPPSGVFAGLALVVLVWGVVDRQLFRDGELQLQTLGMIGFGAVALVGLTIDSDPAVYVVAAGWLLHGGWDLTHYWRDKVVPRSYAEWCGLLDIMMAIGLVFLI